QQIEIRCESFVPMAEEYLRELLSAIELAQQNPPGEDSRVLIAGMLDPAVRLKANGGMFRYPLVTKIGARLIEFLDRVEKPDEDVIEIATAFHSTMGTVMTSHVTGSADKHISKLIRSLDRACAHYFEHN